MKISFSEFALPRSGAVVVGIWEERVLTEPARRLDEATGGAVSRAVGAAARFHGKKNELLPIIGPPELKLSRIFDWYADDFGGKAALAEYVWKYSGRSYRGYTLSFVDYYWMLNEPAS